MAKSIRALAIFLVFPAITFCQSKITVERDTMTMARARDWPHATTRKRALILSNGQIIDTYSTLKLGIGSLPDGDYNFILTSNSLDPKLKFNTPERELSISEIKKKGSKRSGYRYEIICQGNYVVDIDEALASGEIIP